MTTLAVIAKAMNFLDHLGNRKAWGLAITVCAMCFTFLGNFVWTYQDNLASFQKQSIELASIERDRRAIQEIYDEYPKAFLAYLEVFNQIEATFGTLDMDDATRKAKIQHGFDLLSASKHLLSVVSGRINGLELRNERLAVLKKDLNIDLVNLSKTLDRIEEIFRLGDPDLNVPRAQAVAAVNEFMSQADNMIETARARFTTFHPQVLAELDKATIEVRQEERRKSRFAIQSWLTIPAVIYVVGFGVISYRAWRQYPNGRVRSSRRHAPKRVDSGR